MSARRARLWTSSSLAAGACLSCAPPPASLPIPDTRSPWHDVRALPGVTGRGTDADPYRGWETQLTGGRVVYHFPAGVYEFDRVRIGEVAVRLVGDGPYATTLRGRRGDGVAVELSGNGSIGLGAG